MVHHPIHDLINVIWPAICGSIGNPFLSQNPIIKDHSELWKGLDETY